MISFEASSVKSFVLKNTMSLAKAVPAVKMPAKTTRMLISANPLFFPSGSLITILLLSADRANCATLLK